MATDEGAGREAQLETPRLAGGPGPTPPGVDDGTPQPTAEAPGEDPPAAAAQQEEGEVAERSAGTRIADLRQARRDPEEPDPS